MYRTFYFCVLILLFSTNGCNRNQSIVKIIVHDEVMGSIDKRLFGHFLEKPSWHGEWGPEAALKPGTHELQEGVIEIMQGMDIPVLRFPGGTDVNEQDWTTMIDNVPGREAKRPVFVGHHGDTVTNNFGYDEACRLGEKLGAEMMLVVNFGDAYFKRKTIHEAAMHEAGLLAYCNATTEDQLPRGMPDWPALRAKNGHPEPYRVKYIQIANEPWVMDRRLKRMNPIDPELKEHYFNCLESFINLFKKIDPDIQIIADGNSKELTLPLKERFGDKIDYLAYHIYKPWGINKILVDGTEIPFDSLSAKDIWNAWVAVPEFNEQGYSIIDNRVFNMVKAAGYPVAVTEWNWNGWWGDNSVNQDMLGSHFTKGIGAAGFIHAMIRESDYIAIANQSMLIGKSWGITGIRVSPHEEFAPHPYPTGQITGFYSKYHGNKLLKTSVNNMPIYQQPYQMSGIFPVDTVACLDILSTKSEDKVYLHVINRHFSDNQYIIVDLSELGNISRTAIQRSFEGKIENEPCMEGSMQTGCFYEKEIAVSGRTAKINVPKRSVVIVEFTSQ